MFWTLFPKLNSRISKITIWIPVFKKVNNISIHNDVNIWHANMFSSLILKHHTRLYFKFEGRNCCLFSLSYIKTAKIEFDQSIIYFFVCIYIPIFNYRVGFILYSKCHINHFNINWLSHSVVMFTGVRKC